MIREGDCTETSEASIGTLSPYFGTVTGGSQRFGDRHSNQAPSRFDALWDAAELMDAAGLIGPGNEGFDIDRLQAALKSIACRGMDYADEVHRYVLKLAIEASNDKEDLRESEEVQFLVDELSLM